MRKIFYIGILAILIGFQSCTVLTTSVKVQAPRFTTIDKLVELKVGMNFDEVVTKLGSQPYDMYYLSFESKETVYIWYYNKLERKEDPAVLKTKSGGTSGDETMLTNHEKVYITFDDSRKLIQATTDAGLGKSDTKTTLGVSETTTTATKKKFWEFWK